MKIIMFNNLFMTNTNFIKIEKNDNKFVKLLNKIELLEKKILEYFNFKLDINLTGKEIILDLNNKNIGNIELDLLSGVEFKNLEELNLSHNNISNVEPIKNFKTAKSIDLSFNKINNITALKELSENNKEIKKLDLSNNEINNVEILKKNIFPTLIDIDLDDNNILKKDIEEIKNIVKENSKSIIYKNEEDFRKYYVIIEKISESRLSYIYKAKSKENGELRAIKIISINKIIDYIRNGKYKVIYQEDIKPYIDYYNNLINNMKILEGKNKENENTVKYYEYFHTKTELAIIMELCNDNLNNLLSKRKKPFKYEEVYEILKQLNNSFKILNNYKLIHSKLYLKNILIKYENKEKSKFIIKLKPSPTYANGLKFKLQYDKYYYFIAPEILIGNGYNEECDLWSLGIMIYHLIFGEIPYDGKDRNSLLQEITKKGSKIRKTENSDLNDLISKLLMQNPNKRITWEEYFNHPFFTNKII